ncbi:MULTISPECIES: thermostable hemolysin [Halomonadaceae]|mgnify:FL=1|uniref:Thermostable hemolysin n=2 Tax=Vreelandella TaxID=3137766 RepID=A0A7Z0LTZ9_9GAMM|nr:MULTISPECIES: thermostable hemolysin [Halomonas]AJY48561.1 Thermostable hemolysin [Halomonas sp. KO116]NYS78576.1 thermostable hemolysin [Halomonas glaciei]|tara:strand:- start:2415 stop:3056 length:642 start_codon:yes stop_codon:yes gene_type:complete
MARLRSLPTPLATLDWHEALNWQEKAMLQQLIQQRFAQQHSAYIQHFLPRLFGLWQAGLPQAAVGLRLASSGPLFLERYLDGKAEQVINHGFQQSLARRDIAEIGNLASLRPGLQRQLFIYLAHQLAAEGIAWLLFTATPEVANGLRRLGLEPQPITPADPTRLGEASHLWGRYYQHRPWVMAGDLRSAMHTLQAHSAFTEIAREEVLHARLA